MDGYKDLALWLEESKLSIIFVSVAMLIPRYAS